MTNPLAELALVFLKLGCISFGGPAAHIAMMEDEVVRRRNWISRGDFLDYVGATNLIPGPNSTELAIHVGQSVAGWPGLIVAGTCFILPAALIVATIASVYVRFGTLPEVSGALYGIKPVIIAIVLQALWGLGRTAIKNRLLAALTIAIAIAALAGVNELVLLFIGAAAVVALRASESNSRASASPLFIGLIAGAPSATLGVGLWPLFAAFLKIGSVLFGSGYVLLAFLRSEFVDRLHWLSDRQLLDAIAVGQVTPGPVFTTATFVGFLLHGRSGAAVATIGIFLPAFVFVALSGVLLPKIRRSPTLRSALDGVNAASLALMAAVTIQLARAAIVDWITVTLAVVAAILLLRWRLNSFWLVLLGAAVGGATA